MKQATIEYKGTNLVINTLDNCSVSTFISRYETFYELEFLEMLAHILPPGSTVIDVGAHIGNHSVFLAKIAGLKVLAFEPNPIAYEALEKNVAENQLQDSVRLFNVALGNRTDSAFLAPIDFSDVGTSAVSWSDDAEDFTPILVRTLDSFAKELQECPQVSAIKIDVEGSEQSVVEGARNTINSFRPLVTTETQSEVEYDVLQGLMGSIEYKPISVFNPTPTVLWRSKKHDSNPDKYSDELANHSIRYGIRHALRHNDLAVQRLVKKDEDSIPDLPKEISASLALIESKYQLLSAQEHRQELEYQNMG